jgi:DNA mismatch repair protein MutL
MDSALLIERLETGGTSPGDAPRVGAPQTVADNAGTYIRRLSASVVNKIAAGEVIERPASVVKELVENALDAGATRIDVTVEGGGTELVRVTDNGRGIAADELELAVASHATSKLRTADDLFRVGTLGFRGEALASIAEVSRLSIRSRPPAQQAGARLDVVGGRLEEIAPCGSPPGTTVEVSGLFYNTPVRRKFLRTTQTEMGHVTEAFTRLALAHPQVHFTLRGGERTVHDLPADEPWLERIGRFFGAELAAGLIWVESRDGDVALAGYVAEPSHSRSHPRMQYLFLNGRHIRDRSLQHALGEAYRGLLLTGRYPISFLGFQMPPDLVDVNVHPTKLEVRFQDGGRLYSQLLGTLRTRFLTTDLTARLQPGPAEGGAAAHDERRAGELRQELVQWAQGQLLSPGGAADAVNDPAGRAPWEPDERPSAGDSRVSGPFSGDETRRPLELHSVPREWSAPPPTSSSGPSAPASVAPRPVPALQVHDRYLIAESEEGIVVIDQHALHERILYEQMRDKVLAGAVESQSLLVPEPVDLTAAEAAAAIENRDLLARLGIGVDHFGGDTVLLTSYPAMLANFGPAEVLRAAVDSLLAGGQGPQRRDLLDELLHMIACKAAIKAGDRLSAPEVAALVAQRHLVRDTHHCPHGRPTALVFTREELDRQFKRT